MTHMFEMMQGFPLLLKRILFQICDDVSLNISIAFENHINITTSYCFSCYLDSAEIKNTRYSQLCIILFLLLLKHQCVDTLVFSMLCASIAQSNVFIDD